MQKPTLKIKHRSNMELIIYLILVINFSEGLISIFLPMIHPIYYLVDVLNVLLLLWIVRKRRSNIFRTNSLLPFSYSLYLFLGLSVLGILIHFSNVLLHLWGLRTVFSVYVFFVGCILFERSDKTQFLTKVFWINTIATIIEVLLGYRQDWIGGIYGVQGGQVNGPLNLLLVIVISKEIVEYFNKKTTLKRVALYGLTSIIVASFAELKFYYIEFLLIIAISSLVTRFSVRKLSIIILGALGISLGINMLFRLFPDIDNRMFSINFIWNYLTNKGGYVGQFAHNAGDINRLAFWSKISDLYDNVFEMIFGKGLGNCDQISVLGLQSPFFTRYNYLHYYMFPLPMTLLQQGIVGGVIYIMLFVFILYAVKKQQKKGQKERSIYQIAEVLCIMAFVITIYDSSLQGRGAFLYYYMLALPFLPHKRKEIRK